MPRYPVLFVSLLMAAAACNGSDAGSSTDDPTTTPVATDAATTDAATTDAATTDAATTDTAPDPVTTDPARTDPAATSAVPEPSEPTPEPSEPPDEGSAPPVAPTPTPTPTAVSPLYEAGDIDRGLLPFIELAAADLAAHLDVAVDTISTHAAVLVVWPDASIGCPLPDMRYAQVQTDGSVIELEHDGNIYRYHTGGNRGPFVCEQPLTKPPPAEGIVFDNGNDI